ncbi:hypothetical protein GCM10009837_49110 [Streptomyces durmitorensis]|uniref:C2H2-type domain-containing protein n=1 Tax=Streptomyces durmitorensis TaxID=319947 RepID=A0ABY4PY23_9ACTN|nr:hypothetical protein [Streptomyces durmitorensis]UQT58045.1 hypothetical protein M4V62_24780 [Streptomyces durmitorensis]
MSEIADTGHDTTASTATSRTNTAHESYAFACMRCGHGWEQSYEIEHHVDGKGKEFVMYVADGLHVPSPLTRPTCLNCDGHVVRIMRAGQVSSVLNLMQRHHAPRAAAGDKSESGAESEAESGADAAETHEAKHHHWHLSALLHPFHHRKAG